jgi:DNA-binding Xre family transcriptional regulator
MLKYNLKRLINNRAVLQPVGYLKKFGFTFPTAARIVGGRFSTLKLSQLENLCIAFHCTPNDLLEYIPDDKIKTQNHPLTSLIRNEQTKKVNEILNDIPIDMLASFTNKIDELKKDMLKNK